MLHQRLRCGMKAQTGVGNARPRGQGGRPRHTPIRTTERQKSFFETIQRVAPAVIEDLRDRALPLFQDLWEKQGGTLTVFNDQNYLLAGPHEKQVGTLTILNWPTILDWRKYMAARPELTGVLIPLREAIVRWQEGHDIGREGEPHWICQQALEVLHRAVRRPENPAQDLGSGAPESYVRELLRTKTFGVPLPAKVDLREYRTLESLQRHYREFSGRAIDAEAKRDWDHALLKAGVDPAALEAGLGPATVSQRSLKDRRKRDEALVRYLCLGETLDQIANKLGVEPRGVYQWLRETAKPLDFNLRPRGYPKKKGRIKQ